MERLRIAGITITLDYHHEDYYKNNLEKYVVEDAKESDHHIRILLEDEIEAPKMPKDYRFRNRIFYKDKEKEALAVFDKEGTIRMRIDNTKDLKQFTIRFRRDRERDLAEEEYIVTGMMFLRIALARGRLSLHGSAISHKGEAVVFAAPSRTGKSTHRRLWEETFSDTEIINDDKPLIYEEDGRILIAGTPFSGKHRLNNNIIRPLRAIIFLEQAEKNTIRLLTDKERLHHLMRNIYRPGEEVLWDELFRLVEPLMKSVPMYLLSCTKSIEAAHLAKNHVFGKELS